MNNKFLNISILVSVFLLFLITSVVFGFATYLEQECEKKIKTVKTQEEELRRKQQIENSKLKAQKFLQSINMLITEENKKLKTQIKQELKKKVDTAYLNAQYIYNRYKNKNSNKKRIIEIVKNLTFNTDPNIFITNYYGDPVLLGSQKLDIEAFNFYMDADSRSIILEELQKVRKYKEGFLESDFYEKGKNYIIYVKDLEMFELFAGAMSCEEEEQERLDERLLGLLQHISIDETGVLVVYKNEKRIFASKNTDPLKKTNKLSITQQINNTPYKIVYGFDIKNR